MRIYYLYISKYWTLEILKINRTVVLHIAHIHGDRFNRTQRRISTRGTLGVICTCA